MEYKIQHKLDANNQKTIQVTRNGEPYASVYDDGSVAFTESINCLDVKEINMLQYIQQNFIKLRYTTMQEALVYDIEHKTISLPLAGIAEPHTFAAIVEEIQNTTEQWNDKDIKRIFKCELVNGALVATVPNRWDDTRSILFGMMIGLDVFKSSRGTNKNPSVHPLEFIADKKIAVQCHTKKQAEQLQKMLKSSDMLSRFDSTDMYKQWYRLGKETAFTFHISARGKPGGDIGRVIRVPVADMLNCGYTIIPAADIIPDEQMPNATTGILREQTEVHN